MASKGQTGTSDPTYNLISVAYHALQAAETHEQYTSDAESQGDQDLAQFFRQTQQQFAQVAQQAKQLLTSRLQGDIGGSAAMRAGALGSDQSAVMGHAGSKPNIAGEENAAAGSTGGAGAADDAIAREGKVG